MGSPTGGAAVKIEGLDDFRKRLAEAGDPKAVKAHFKRAEKIIAQRVALVANAEAAGSSGVTRHYPKGVKGKSTARGASVYPWKKASYPAFWGAKPGKRSGWNRTSYLRKNAKTHTSVRTNAPGKSSASAVRTRRNLGGKPQFPAWVGNSWQAGVRGQGPYAINSAVADSRPQIEQMYLKAMEQVARRAFPDT